MLKTTKHCWEEDDLNSGERDHAHGLLDTLLFRCHFPLKIDLYKKDIVGGFTLLDLKTYGRGPVLETVWYWCKVRNVDQCNRISDLAPHRLKSVEF